ncbi:MAG: protein kinase domain-containing protein [Longimicrobiales bacterium]
MADSIQGIRSALGDRYEVVSHLGTGGMADVFLARDRFRMCDVALKVIRPELAAVIGADRFLREIAITARLFHPHIRPLLDSGEVQGTLYYAMPYIKGQTLRDRLKRERRLGFEESLRIARALADGLDYAHQQGVIHRDVKPGNVFIDGAHPVLTDFGIAIAAESADSERLTESGIVIGTPEYLSPEQCEGGEHIDGRADLYSLGCVLFEMLTGQPPFTGRTRISIIAKQISEAAPSATTLRPDLPEEADQLLRRCLSKTPADRFSTASELRTSIDEVLTGWQTGSLRHGKRESGLRIPRPVLIAGILVVALALGVWLATRTPAVVLDSNKVMVFPLANRGGQTDGSAMAMGIANALLHAEPLKPIDGYTYLNPDQRADPARTSLSAARAIALSRGATHFITGGVTTRGDSTSVLLTLHDARTDTVVHNAAFTGAHSRFTAEQVGIRAMIDLLPELIDPGRKIDLSILTDRDAAAVSLWIRGDLEYRRARFTNALTHYRDAVRKDSLLVIAAVKGAQAASWVEQSDVADELSRIAVANDSILPMRYRHFIRALRAHLEGRADDAVRQFREALALQREWSEAWMGLGEVYQHLLPRDLRADSSAQQAFETAAALDPDFAPPLVHLSEYAIRNRDLLRAETLVKRLRESGADGVARVAATAVVLDCARRSLDPARWQAEATRSADVVLEAAQQLATGGAYLDCAAQGFRSLLGLPNLAPNKRWAATLGLQSVLVAQGHAQQAQALLDTTVAAGISAALFLPPLDVLAGADLSAGARRVDSIALSRWPDFRGAGPRTLWLLGSWRAHLGDHAAVTAIRLRMAEADTGAVNPRNRLMGKAIAARQALMARDTAAAIDSLRSLYAVGTRAELLTAMNEAFPAERVLLAQLLLVRGQLEEAYWTAAALDHPQPLLFTAFVPRSLALRYRAASALPGSLWRARAAEARRRLQAMGRADLLAAAS